MCEFCTKHGEGKKWYLNAKNYSDDLLSDLKRREYIKDFFYNVGETDKKYYNIVKKLPLNIPILGSVVKAIIRNRCKSKHWGQVIPIEDVERILALTNTIVRVPCVCTKSLTGKIIRKCFGICLNPERVNMVDSSYMGGPDVAKFETMDKKEALDFIKGQELNGAFHSVWTMGTPFIGGLCNCGKDNCLSMGMYKDVTPVFFKSEYIIEKDIDKCNGCKECLKICPFEALTYDQINRKVIVDKNKCVGCGICRSVCDRNALMLSPRVENPEVVDLW